MKRKPKGHLILRLLREAAGMSQTEIAMELGGDRFWVSRVENGGHIEPETVKRWVSVCGGVELIDWLIDHLRALKDYVRLLTDTDYYAFA
ncbi:helix-turn-helix domain-containing protein [Alicyclobacillus vulcanalis]|uniref:Helix-turn-helix domain-containing protein n=1 Tax=Alicyclobacillus vulcanalis TaxID=252246 RepID=A0A1N7MT10_9BACL|nr:helix-turn-helix transcriptional regulator [Alicyclobacillus vulcanalis]SIS88989.1 Helix-turn-helix domain-containing protein [Alicyclobacillus vulcanalis]